MWGRVGSVWDVRCAESQDFCRLRRNNNKVSRVFILNFLFLPLFYFYLRTYVLVLRVDSGLKIPLGQSCCRHNLTPRPHFAGETCCDDDAHTCSHTDPKNTSLHYHHFVHETS